MLVYVGIYIFIAFIAVPIYQNISFVPESTEVQNNSYDVILNVICCKCRPVKRDDENIVTTNLMRNKIKSSRYVPFSTYNFWYMITNPGQELNPSLPDDLEVFGGLRAYFLFQQITSYGALKLLLFISIVSQIYMMQNGNEDNADKVRDIFISSLTLFGALLDLRSTVIAVAFFFCGFTYIITTLVYPVAIFICPLMTDMIVNPPRGSMTFDVLLFFWNKCSE